MRSMDRRRNSWEYEKGNEGLCDVYMLNKHDLDKACRYSQADLRLDQFLGDSVLEAWSEGGNSHGSGLRANNSARALSYRMVYP
jgi:hypothetical protein